MKRILFASVVGLAPLSVMADPVAVDTAATVAQLGVINTTTAAIGAALLVAAAIAVTFKWAKATIFG